MYSTEDLAKDFRAIGITPGDTVMLHASVRAVGEVAGGPDSIHLALKSALTEEGTLMMYASCPRYYDEVGRGELSLDQERELRDKLPAFNPLTARSARDNGALVELLRTYPGSCVNHHVARFVCWGRQAGHLISIQPWNYALGRDSALERFLAADGKIVLLGSDHDAVTFLHYVEHIADISQRQIARYDVPVLQDGRRVWLPMEEVDTSDRGAHANWPERFFAKIVDSMLDAAGIRGGRVGDAMTYVFTARELFAFAQPLMEAVAANPHAANSLIEHEGHIRGEP
ncbi:aminoglycoside N3-acetyltransferase [Acidisarcina polymorpha]|uniref:Aminoglycoside N(3)-acetyltransferase n=1 Tax=Acidisarcina polymorpha TaxID=2211140 RepID=A0A2Z5FY02_9BACT|nr:AAC(3) family N-acetyltransferase [Acidisarcina polymorpha]AXC11347.1 aminoglycoside N3-acetyltransferase [Acidisarcina polymorpha]